MSTADKVLQALQSYGLEKEGANKYRANSPLRPGSNSHAFSLIIEGDEHGAYHDFVSGDKGSLYELAKHLNIDTPATQVASTKRAYSGIYDYGAAHGIDAITLTEAGWYETMYKDRPALAIPTKNGTRYRFLDGQKPHYISPKGYARCWYGLDMVTMQRVASGSPLVLCNGEISTVTGKAYGLAAACVTAGENSLTPELMIDLKTFLGNGATEIIIALDCDAKGATAAKQVESQLIAAGYKARAVDLALGRGGDLADFCMLHGESVMSALLACKPLESVKVADIPTRNWVMMTEDELDSLPPVEWLFPGEIPRRALVVIFGQSGAGKSFLAMDYGLKLAESERVVYVASEGESGITQRVKAWRKHHKLTGGKHNIRYVLGAVNLFEKEDFEDFLHEMTPVKPSMVVIDTLGMSMSGADENSARDVAIVVTACKRIMFSLDCTVVLVHHLNKAGVAERGSGFLRNASDVMIKVSPEDDLVRVESSKTKDVSPFPTRYLKQVSIDLGVVDSLGQPVSSLVLIPADKVIQSKEDRLPGQQTRVLEVLMLEVYKEGADAGELESATGILHSSMTRVLSKLLVLGFINQPGGKRSPYCITDAGRKKMEVQGSLTPLTLDSSASTEFENDENQQPEESRSQRSQRSQATVFDEPRKPNQYTLGY